jgi:hypothetical protein
MPQIKPSTVPRYVAGSLFLLVLLIIPTGAFAADIFPPRQETQGQVLPGSCSGNCCPPTTKTCLNEWEVQTESDWIISDGTNYTEYMQISVANCTAGCSSTLGNCRPDNFTQGIILLLYIAFTAALIYFAPYMGPIGYLIDMIIIIAGLAFVLLIDVFAQSQLIFILYTLAAAVFILFHNFFNESADSDTDQPDASGDASA